MPLYTSVKNSFTYKDESIDVIENSTNKSINDINLNQESKSFMQNQVLEKEIKSTKIKEFL